MSKYEALWNYIQKQSDETLILTFAEIEKIAGLPIDHSFLQYKKELTAFGWCVDKISLKAQTVRFIRNGQALKKPIVTTARLTVTPMSDSELAALIEANRLPVPELAAAYTEMLDGCVKNPDKRLWYTSWKFCLRDSGAYIGDAGFKGPGDNGAVEIGYGVNDEYAGQGYATEGVNALCQWALTQSGVAAVEAETDANNEASKRVLSKLGFVPTGQIGDEGPRFVLRRIAV